MSQASSSVQAEFVAGELVQFLQVALGVGLGARRQFVEEIQHLLRRFRHLGGQRNFGVVVEAEQLRRFAAQPQDFGDQRRCCPSSALPNSEARVT